MPKHVGAIGQITIKVERGLLRRYRAQCVLRGTTPTANVAKLIVAQLDRWLTREAQQDGLDAPQGVHPEAEKEWGTDGTSP